MEEKTIEIRTRWKNDHTRWEDIFFPWIENVTKGQEEQRIRSLSWDKEIVEIRWNYVGSSQGHYIDMTKR